jgi:pimeloyl-ACP methyl ester carboxylesterase
MPGVYWPVPEVCCGTVSTATGPVGYLDAGNGRPVLYFHGTGAGNDLAAVMERALIEDECRLITPNRPGYLDTPLSCGQSSSDAARLACQVLDELNVERVIVIGTSGGGFPALSFARAFPERAAGLVLQCAQSHPWDSPTWLPEGKGWILKFVRRPAGKRLIHWAHHIQTRALRWTKSQCLKMLTGNRFCEVQRDPAAIELRDTMIEHSIQCVKQPAGIENDLDILLREKSVPDRAVKCPTLIIHDRLDPVVPFRHAEWSRSVIPGAEVLDVHAGGHLIWIGRDADRMRKRRLAFIRQNLNG